jgi:hypothetical protein
MKAGNFNARHAMRVAGTALDCDNRVWTIWQNRAGYVAACPGNASPLGLQFKGAVSDALSKSKLSLFKAVCSLGESKMQKHDMTIAQALTKASIKVGVVHKSGCMWTFARPYDPQKPDGAGAAKPAEYVSQSTAAQIRANYVACIALHYLGYDGEDYQEGSAHIDYLTHGRYGVEFLNARALLRQAITRIGEQRAMLAKLAAEEEQ